MLNHIDKSSSATFAPLVGEIVADLEKLCREEISFARSEIHRELVYARNVAIGLIIGMGVIALATVGGILWMWDGMCSA